ncbi:hypothetical protein BH20ACT5_BH20ACT5_15290 [soil metagenome]
MSVIIAEQYDRVIGEDTHAATHSWAVVAAGTGAVLDHAQFDTAAAGLGRAHGWLGRAGRRPVGAGGRGGRRLLRGNPD